MSDLITYKGKSELDAIAAWSNDHPDATEFLRAIFTTPLLKGAPIAVCRRKRHQKQTSFDVVPVTQELQTTPAEAAEQFLATPKGQVFAEVIKKATIGTFREALGELRPKLETPDLLDGLNPDGNAKDAGAYMAMLVCHVWMTQSGYSAKKALNYVFRNARENSPLYADCKYARTLRDKYGRSESTVWKDAKILHSSYNTWSKKSKKPYMPNVWRELAQKSKGRESREIKAKKERQRRNMV